MARCRFSRKRADRIVANVKEGLPLSVSLEGLSLADLEDWRERNKAFRQQFDDARHEAVMKLARRQKHLAFTNHEAIDRYAMLFSQEAALAHLNGMTSEPIAA